LLAPLVFDCGVFRTKGDYINLGWKGWNDAQEKFLAFQPHKNHLLTQKTTRIYFALVTHNNAL